MSWCTMYSMVIIWIAVFLREILLAYLKYIWSLVGSQAWWSVPVIPALVKLRHEGYCKFKVILVYIERPRLKKPEEEMEKTTTGGDHSGGMAISGVLSAGWIRRSQPSAMVSCCFGLTLLFLRIKTELTVFQGSYGGLIWSYAHFQYVMCPCALSLCSQWTSDYIRCLAKLLLNAGSSWLWVM